MLMQTDADAFARTEGVCRARKGARKKQNECKCSNDKPVELLEAPSSSLPIAGYRVDLSMCDVVLEVCLLIFVLLALLVFRVFWLLFLQWPSE